MQAGVGLLVTYVMPIYTWSCLDNLIIIRFSINCSTVICSPTVILMLSWEKPLVKPMPPGSIFYQAFNLLLFASFTFPIYIIKIPKIFILLYYLYQISLSQVAVKGLSTPLLRWLRVLVFLCRCVGLLRSLLLDWYLGSQKLREILTLLCCITLSSSRKTNTSSRCSTSQFCSGPFQRRFGSLCSLH